MNIEQAKTIPISVILDKMNRFPQREKGADVWYLSPFRIEKTPSFKVNTNGNVWYDHGIGKGGDVIELVRIYLESENESCEVKDALRWTRNMTGFVPRIKPVPIEDFKKDDATLALKEAGPIKNRGLVTYGESRGIPESVLRSHLLQVSILNNKSGKTIFALGMKNESKGYELRNPFFKGCVHKKDVTFIRGSIPKPNGIHLFEGFMDYLSVITQREGGPLDDDAIILHSLSCLDKGSAYIRNYGYKTCYTWMDNDQPGIHATESWKEFCGHEENLIHIPMNEAYAPYKDVNAHHMFKLEL